MRTSEGCHVDCSACDARARCRAIIRSEQRADESTAAQIGVSERKEVAIVSGCDIWWLRVASFHDATCASRFSSYDRTPSKMTNDQECCLTAHLPFFPQSAAEIFKTFGTTSSGFSNVFYSIALSASDGMRARRTASSRSSEYISCTSTFLCLSTIPFSNLEQLTYRGPTKSFEAALDIPVQVRMSIEHAKSDTSAICRLNEDSYRIYIWRTNIGLLNPDGVRGSDAAVFGLV